MKKKNLWTQVISPCKTNKFKETQYSSKKKKKYEINKKKNKYYLIEIISHCNQKGFQVLINNF